MVLAGLVVPSKHIIPATLIIRVYSGWLSTQVDIYFHYQVSYHRENDHPQYKEFRPWHM